MTGESTGTNGPVGVSASSPFVDFSRWTAGAGGIRLTIVQVTMASSGTVPRNPVAVVTKPGSGLSVGESGVR